mmetsp:Transcript_5076/g.8724  ORF Transcript_5076/g.8724 Transcript_5076/m.8724 type:complete len:307 (-) Transcript_5076:182-1102(-)|eukprot:CAMPEP_0196667492 /NCGR_PEP_ID=MMETSP1086-20130531/65111_1 /TAXON_ID=77921 /ORGANISM="Cyanoptyche  gloeocystis , Strain SAG4.97" /LENGTH=306 /DNA_ID=CAMNT_0042004825 /DNA_START=139 /DNA_END=1059 /DNA_ORIENTATION=+
MDDITDGPSVPTPTLRGLRNCRAAEWVKLNVGGVTYHTTRTTLCMDKDSVLAKMFGDSGWTSAIDESGAYLIDREARYFRPLLNFLRDGVLLIDPDTCPEGVLNEAKYFNIQGIVEILQPQVRQDRPAGAPGSWRDEQDAELTRKDIILALVKTPTDGKLRLQGLHLPGLDLSKLDLSGVNLSMTNLASANLRESNLVGANLDHTLLTRANLEKASMAGANLQGADCTGATFISANLQGANLSGSILVEAKLQEANLQFANLQGANLNGANLQRANLNKCLLKGANFAGVNRLGTNLTDGGLLYAG